MKWRTLNSTRTSHVRGPSRNSPETLLFWSFLFWNTKNSSFFSPGSPFQIPPWEQIKSGEEAKMWFFSEHVEQWTSTERVTFHQGPSISVQLRGDYWGINTPILLDLYIAKWAVWPICEVFLWQRDDRKLSWMCGTSDDYTRRTYRLGVPQARRSTLKL